MVSTALCFLIFFMTVSFIGLKYFKGFVCKPVEDFKKSLWVVYWRRTWCLRLTVDGKVSRWKHLKMKMFSKETKRRCYLPCIANAFFTLHSFSMVNLFCSPCFWPFTPCLSLTLATLSISWRCFTHTHTNAHTILWTEMFDVRNELPSAGSDAFSLPKSLSLLCIQWAIAYT